MSKDKKKPRVNFCWECGNKLWGNSFTEMHVEGHDRILHKQCAKFIKNGLRLESINYDGSSDTNDLTFFPRGITKCQ